MQAIHYYFIRHGETEAEINNVIEGWQDSPLTPRGIEQMKALHESFSDLPIALVFSSPLERAIQSAELLIKGRDPELTVTTNDSLKEYGFGGLEGETFRETFDPSINDQILTLEAQKVPETQLLPELTRQIAAIDETGETERFIDFWSRIEEAMLQIHDDALEYRIDHQKSEINVMIVGHQFAISAFLHEVLSDFELTDRLNCGHYARVTYQDGHYTLDEWNEK
ncbi:MAG: histidine phosphatase family protein [Aerococcus sp.]|nr:histidine phosphatase family protein [Aerococcus sp.]